MCGILAYFNRNGITQEHIKATAHSLQSIRHRGPDGEGLVLINSKTGDYRIVITSETPVKNLPGAVLPEHISDFKADLIFGHRRLSIIDLSANGHQPMLDENGNWIVFNGEIYNYLEIKNELQKKNHRFKTDSDTEVILKAYNEWGTECVKQFNGMFSVVLYDKNKNKLLVLNDRFSVKPLYVYSAKNELLLASEIRQFFPFNYKLTYNEKAFDNFLSHAYLDYNNETFYNEVNRFPCSSYALIELNKEHDIHPKVYYELNKSVIIPGKDVVDKFRHLLDDSVRLRLRSDVPVGFASSGGLDSSSILYSGYSILKKAGLTPDVATFSAIFPGMEGDESEFIRIIENDLKIKSNYTNPLEQFNIEDFEKHITFQEFPVQSTSFYAEWCVSRLVHESNVKVLLVGQGGDEILAGYHHHFYRYCRQLILSGKVAEYLSVIKKYSELKNMNLNSLHRKVLDEIKVSLKFKLGLNNISNKLNEKWNKADKLIELMEMDLREFTLPTYLRSGDRSAMAFSIEARHPFLDYRLVDFCFSLPDDLKIKEGWQKYILRKAMPDLPDTISYRKDKKGFTTPQRDWVEKYKTKFEEYSQFIPEPYKNYKTNEFLKYSLGAWLKLYN